MRPHRWSCCCQAHTGAAAGGWLKATCTSYICATYACTHPRIPRCQGGVTSGRFQFSSGQRASAHAHPVADRMNAAIASCLVPTFTCRAGGWGQRKHVIMRTFIIGGGRMTSNPQQWRHTRGGTISYCDAGLETAQDVQAHMPVVVLACSIGEHDCVLRGLPGDMCCA